MLGFWGRAPCDVLARRTQVSNLRTFRLRCVCRASAPSSRKPKPAAKPKGDKQRAARAPGGRKPKPTTRPAGDRQRAEPQRLSKVLAAAGVASRRAAEELIFEGRVLVNNKAETLPQTKVLPGKDKISVNGKPLASQRPKQLYFALNKPKGYICSSTASDHAQQTPRLAVDLFDDWIKRSRRKDSDAVPPRLFTVGRLDVQSTGLILVTNDGTWANKVSHPSSGITKEYVVTTNERPTRRQLQQLCEGCLIDGQQVQPVDVLVETSDPSQRKKIRIVLAEGKNREVRKLISAIGLEVVYLKRVRVGGFRMPKDLGIGQFRELKQQEVQRVLDKGAQQNPYV